ncbi:hypothetical protein ACQEU3_40280 [Spirillospora sp. CA-253888]
MPGPCGDLPEPGLELVRHRWLIGHQATFLVWRSLAARLRTVLQQDGGDDGGGPAEIAAAALGYDAYSVLLLYSGSCGPEQYEAGVRADMRAHDPAFSGEWAPDHQGLPDLYQAVVATCPRRTLNPLVRAFRTNRRIHRLVADRLVPGGGSLLRDTGRRPGTPPSPAELTSYDGFFAVRRGEVCRCAIATQTQRLVAQILWDLAVHGLYPYRASPLIVSGPHRRAISRLADQAPQTLSRFCRSFPASSQRQGTP